MVITEELVREYIDEARLICEECIRDFDMPLIDEVDVSRAKSYWAQVRRVGYKTFSIRVSNVFNLIEDECVAKNRLLSSMTHELIHTQPGCMNHLKPFQTMANRVNRKYPQLNVSTGITAESIGLYIPEKPDKYHVICTKCGEVSKYKRRPDIWKYVNKKHSPYTCTKCGNDSFIGKEF